MSSPIDLTQPNRTIHVGVILMNSETEVLDVAPIDLLNGMSKAIENFPDTIFPPDDKKQALDMEFHWVNEKGDPAKLTSGLRILPTDSFESCPPLDIVIMGAHAFSYTPNPTELEFVRKNYEHCAAFLAICGGFQAALQAGLYKDKTVTAPQPALDFLRQTVPDVNWLEKRWHRDGKLWTSGTLLNGLDLMRAFGDETWGGEGTLMERLLAVGHWPKRDVNYADVK